MLEYFFTKERATLENQAAGEDGAVPFAAQLKAIFADKYMLLICAYFPIYAVAMVGVCIGIDTARPRPHRPALWVDEPLQPGKPRTVTFELDGRAFAV